MVKEAPDYPVGDTWEAGQKALLGPAVALLTQVWEHIPGTLISASSAGNFLKLWQNTDDIKRAVLTIFKHTIQWQA